MKKNFLSLGIILIALAIVSFGSCKKDKTPPAPKAEFKFTGDYMKAPVEASFENTSQNAVSYSWDFGDGGSSTEKNPKHTFTEKGTHTIKLTATNEDGKTSTTSKSIKVYGNITSWSPGSIVLHKKAWEDEDDDITIYMSVWTSNNTVYDYAGDGTFRSYDITENTTNLNFNISNVMTLAMNANSKVTLKFQLFGGGQYVNPNIDPIVYQKVINGSDVLPSNAVGPYMPTFKVPDFLTVDIKWAD